VDFSSAQLVFVALVDDQRSRKSHLWDETVVVFRAEGSESAVRRALEIGRSDECGSLNRQGRQVRWGLVEIECVDGIGRKVDGEEVASRLRRRRSRRAAPFDAWFHPEFSKPAGTA
jgi:hypothetical protein